MQGGTEELNKDYNDAMNRINNQRQGFRELAKRARITYVKRPLTTNELVLKSWRSYRTLLQFRGGERRRYLLLMFLAH